MTFLAKVRESKVNQATLIMQACECNSRPITQFRGIACHVSFYGRILHLQAL